MAEALALVPAQGPDEAPLDASAIRSRVEQFSLEQRRLGGVEEEEEEEQAEVADAEVALGAYKVAREAMDEWDSTTAAASVDDFDAYLEQLRNDVAMWEERNQKLSEEISATAETAFNDMTQLDVGFEMLESLFSNLGPKALNHDESSVLALSDSTDSCRNQNIVDKDYLYELELDRQIEKSRKELEVLQHVQRDDEMFQLESMLLQFGAKVLDFAVHN